MTGLRFLTIIVSAALLYAWMWYTVVVANHCQTQQEAITADNYVTRTQGDHFNDPMGVDGPHTDLNPDFICNPKGSPDLCMPTVKAPSTADPATIPIPPKSDPNAMQQTSVILLYFCGDNIAIEHIYANLKGDTDVKIYARWNFPSIPAYNKELARLEFLARLPVSDASPVYIMELNDRCNKS